jgi:hypothetical protein
MKQQYFLQENNQRLMIDTEIHKGFELHKSIIAESWIQSKKLLGFELTGYQEFMLIDGK